MNHLLAQLEDPTLTPYQRLLRLFAILRSPEGCAWDRKQTHQSLLPYLLEEAYEVIEAVESGDDNELKGEIGDLMTQIVFHAQLASERGAFTLDEALTTVTDKLIARHPHVFGDKKDLAPAEVRDQWEKIKSDASSEASVLAGVPRQMPALAMAFRIGEKAGGVGFDWAGPSDVLEKIDEELAEIRQEMARSAVDRVRLSEEIGDLLFAVASLARKLEVDPELALRGGLEKFRSRFTRMEETIKKQGQAFSDFDADGLDTLWRAAKDEVDQ